MEHQRERHNLERFGVASLLTGLGLYYLGDHLLGGTLMFSGAAELTGVYADQIIDLEERLLSYIDPSLKQKYYGSQSNSDMDYRSIQ